MACKLIVLQTLNRQPKILLRIKIYIGKKMRTN